jgi:hypothetical protein
MQVALEFGIQWVYTIPPVGIMNNINDNNEHQDEDEVIGIYDVYVYVY